MPQFTGLQRLGCDLATEPQHAQIFWGSLRGHQGVPQSRGNSLPRSQPWDSPPCTLTKSKLSFSFDKAIFNQSFPQSTCKQMHSCSSDASTSLNLGDRTASTPERDPLIYNVRSPAELTPCWEISQVPCPLVQEKGKEAGVYGD